MSTATCWLCPERNFQICAATSPAAAMLACAATATRNDDGSCGSCAVSVTASSAESSPSTEVQMSERIFLGLCMILTLPLGVQSSALPWKELQWLPSIH